MPAVAENQASSHDTILRDGIIGVCGSSNYQSAAVALQPRAPHASAYCPGTPPSAFQAQPAACHHAYVLHLIRFLCSCFLLDTI